MKRSLIVPMLEVLDFCDTARSTARRNVTSVPTQALTLLNGDFVNRQARHLADRLERDAGPDPAAQIDRAYLLSLCRCLAMPNAPPCSGSWIENRGHDSPRPRKRLTAHDGPGSS